jgi:hypothetical protein
MASVQSYYKAKKAPNLANPIAATTFLQSDNALKSAFVKLAGTTGDTTARFYVSARGRATTGGSLTFIATLQFNKNVNDLTTATGSATSANNTTVFALSARTLATITRPWTIDVILNWDSTSQRLSGTSNGYNAETIETANASITALTGVDLTTGTCGCMVSCIFGTTNASNVATLDDFFVEVL